MAVTDTVVASSDACCKIVVSYLLSGTRPVKRFSDEASRLAGGEDFTNKAAWMGGTSARQTTRRIKPCDTCSQSKTLKTSFAHNCTGAHGTQSNPTALNNMVLQVGDSCRRLSYLQMVALFPGIQCCCLSAPWSEPAAAALLGSLGSLPSPC